MKEMYYWQAIQEAMAEEMERDRRVFLLGEDIAEYGGAFGVTRGLLEKFGKHRIVNTPISEPGIVGLATGAALKGLRPIVEIMFMDFMTLCSDQILNHAAKYAYMYAGMVNVPLVIRTPAGGRRAYGPTHSQSLESWFMRVPGLKVVAPSDPADAKGLLKTAIRDDNPVLFVEHKMLYAVKGPVPKKEYLIPFGQAAIRRSGNDVTIVTYSEMVPRALRTAEKLSEENIDAEVIDLRTLAPLDLPAVFASVKKTGRVLIAEEGWKTGGVGAEISAAIGENVLEYLEAPIRRVAAKDVHIPSSDVLEKLVLPDENDIYDAAMEIMGG
ncbi:alpha-ketoacid dehydrogenase subunit beta [Candidatus Saganbacteria bacterium]|nr:alpha-ketoacid dehydrogenase subunit beta [Candidatus Gottesmanbacteria bacterium]MBI5701735.1 alpha-ketoacid dehydrogenase subunit beta [Candidatus Saganbacteria bacterium]